MANGGGHPILANGMNGHGHGMLPPSAHATIPSCSASWQMPAPQTTPARLVNVNGHQASTASAATKKKPQNGATSAQTTKLKLVMVGSGGVGKSSLTIQARDSFQNPQIS